MFIFPPFYEARPIIDASILLMYHPSLAVVMMCSATNWSSCLGECLVQRSAQQQNYTPLAQSLVSDLVSGSSAMRSIMNISSSNVLGTAKDEFGVWHPQDIRAQRMAHVFVLLGCASAKHGTLVRDVVMLFGGRRFACIRMCTRAFTHTSRNPNIGHMCTTH